MPSLYSEAETEQYYDHEDSVYRALWDKDGSVHWGLFEEGASMTFLEAGDNLNKVMIERGQLTANNVVIDVGCGSGTTAIALCKSVGCKITGVDLSGVRIANAIDSLEDHPTDVQQKVTFQKGSATDLPIEDESFDRAWSQATIYHVPDKVKVLEEVYRVLKPGGRFRVSDVVLTRKLPFNEEQYLASWAGCMAGALVQGEFVAKLEATGFKQVRLTLEDEHQDGVHSALIEAAKLD